VEPRNSLQWWKLMREILRNKSGKSGISIVLTGIIGLAGLCFLLYTWSNMPESGIENPEVGTPILLVGVTIVVVFLLVYLKKRL